MAYKLVTNIQKFIGTAAELAGMTATPPAGSTFYTTDTLAKYMYNGTSWVLSDIIYPAYVAPADQASAAAYADVAGSKIDTLTKGKLVYTIVNTGAETISWKVLASLDDVTYVQIKAPADILAAGVDSYVASATEVSYRYFKIQIVDKVAAAHGAAQVRGYSKI